MTTLVLLLGAGLTFRVVWLWQEDVITEPIRDRIHGWLDEQSGHDDAGGRIAEWMLTLLTCPWCLSVWVGAACYVWWWLHPPTFVPVATVATWSAVAGTVSAGLHK